MTEAKQPIKMKVLQVAVTSGYGSTRPTVYGLDLPKMDKPHIIIFFKGEDGDFYGVMEEKIARNLREELNINLK
ncbi:MAG TPA: hypothetical protein VEH58_05195 [Dehalococcoidales bacterium]|nr:hypothetical protein [Dehalococcoidales bacterium]